MKLIIAGGRDFNDYQKLKEECDKLFKTFSFTEIVSGAAKGADALGVKYAEEIGLPVKVFKPDWKAYGRGAGPQRNRDMADYADFLFAFWDGKSKGTESMIKEARKRNLRVRICRL